MQVCSVTGLISKLRRRGASNNVGYLQTGSRSRFDRNLPRVGEHFVKLIPPDLLTIIELIYINRALAGWKMAPRCADNGFNYHTWILLFDEDRSRRSCTAF